MIAMEGAVADGFEHLGYLETDDLTLHRHLEPEVVMHRRSGDVMRAAQERYEVSIDIRDQGLIERLHSQQEEENE